MLVRIIQGQYQAFLIAAFGYQFYGPGFGLYGGSEIYGVFYWMVLLLLLLTALRLCTSGSAQIPFSFGHDFATSQYLGGAKAGFLGVFLSLRPP
jgi:hypothetical protein